MFTYCLHKTGDRDRAERYYRKMVRYLSDEDDKETREVLRRGTANHAYFAHFKAEETKKLLLQMQGEYSISREFGLNSGIETTRAIRLAIEYGYDLEGKPEFLQGGSLQYAHRLLLDDFERHGKSFERSMADFNIPLLHARKGRFKAMEDELYRIEREAPSGSFLSPSWNVVRKLIEANGRYAVSKGRKGKDLWNAGRLIGELQQMCLRHPGVTVNPWDRETLASMRSVLIDRFGSAPHIDEI